MNFIYRGILHTEVMKMEKDSPMLHGTQPHQTNAPSFLGTGIKIQPPFKNEHGVIIGDSLYNSKQSPLNNWSKDTDPNVMAGSEWVHPTNDIGWNSEENRALLEQMKNPKALFMHPSIDAGYKKD